MMSFMEMMGPIYVLFVFKIFSLSIPTRPELFSKYLTRPVPKSKTPTRRTHTCKKREIPEIYLRNFFGFSAKF